MTDMAMNGFGPLPPETASPDTLPQIEAMLDAITIQTQKSSMDISGAEANDRASAVLKFAQAIAVLDPSLNATGIPLDHEMALKEKEIEGAKVVEEIKERAKAQAPSPVKRVKRTNDGWEMRSE